MLENADECWRMLTYADECWRMLTDADVWYWVRWAELLIANGWEKEKTLFAFAMDWRLGPQVPLLFFSFFFFSQEHVSLFPE
jgi:hypothetical protein